MATFIDRRKNGRNKSSGNRQRFLKRVSDRVKKTVQERIRDGKISDVLNNDGGSVSVPVKDIKEPVIHHGQGGVSERVYPGNKEFTDGDRISRPNGGGGGGAGKGQASADGEGEDEFTFNLTRDEFLHYFFEDLELPDMVKKDIAVIDEYRIRRAGFSSQGSPSKLDVLQSMKQAKGRNFALRNPKRKELKKTQAELDALVLEIKQRQNDGNDVAMELAHKERLEAKIVKLKRKIRNIPFVDDIDLRYRQFIHEPVPATQAVMFCVMDVSGSMTEWHKEMSKRFYMLLYMFLHRNYDRIQMVFIRHHTQATEVTEDEFFHARDTGGTQVSPALKLVDEIIKERYSNNQWNVYVAQASDGDNWHDDIRRTTETIERLLPKVQYFFYIEISDRGDTSELWQSYKGLEARNFDMVQCNDVSEIYPVFRGLFERKQ